MALGSVHRRSCCLERLLPGRRSHHLSKRMRASTTGEERDCSSSPSAQAPSRVVRNHGLSDEEKDEGDEQRRLERQKKNIHVISPRTDGFLHPNVSKNHFHAYGLLAVAFGPCLHRLDQICGDLTAVLLWSTHSGGSLLKGHSTRWRFESSRAHI